MNWSDLRSLVFWVALVTAYFAIRSFMASRRQNELSTVPHLFFEAEGNFPCQKLVLVNDNDKLAFNIKIDRLEVLDRSTEGKDWTITDYTFKLDLKGINGPKRNFISKINSKIPIIAYANGVEMKNDDEGFVAWLLTGHFKIKGGFWVTFTDSQNFRFFTVVNFNADGVTYIKRAPTRLTITWKSIKFLCDTKRFLRKKWWILRITYYINVVKFVH